MMRIGFVILAAGLAGCAQAPSPAPLAMGGLWGRSVEGCAAGVGVRFEDRAVLALNGIGESVIFARPRYRWRETEGGGALEIRYQLPQRPGGVATHGGEGLARLTWHAGEDAITLSAHAFRDVATGSVRASLQGAAGPIGKAFALRRCTPRPGERALAKDKEKGAPQRDAPFAAGLRGLGG